MQENYNGFVKKLQFRTWCIHEMNQFITSLLDAAERLGQFRELHDFGLHSLLLLFFPNLADLCTCCYV